jgi:hypothetical protein
LHSECIEIVTEIAEIMHIRTRPNGWESSI